MKNQHTPDPEDGEELPLPNEGGVPTDPTHPPTGS